MSLGGMLSTNQVQGAVQKLCHDGLNWIIWKHQIQMLIRAKKLGNHLTHLRPPPTELVALGPDAKEEDIKAYEKELEPWLEWQDEEAEVIVYFNSTLPDSLLVKAINVQSAKTLWENLLEEHEGKSETYQAEMLHHLQNKHCSEVEDICVHFVKMLKLCEELASMGKTLMDQEFTSIITNSLPMSIYAHVINSAYTSLKMLKQVPSPCQLIEAVKEGYMCCTLFSSNGPSDSSTALFTNPQGSSSLKCGKKKKVNHCTNTKCRFCHTHEFKDC